MRNGPESVGRGDALLLVDVQNDFLPGGALAVRDGHAVVPRLNEYVALFHDRGLPVLACRDWHPADHCSFHARGGPWPAHCVADTAGAGFAPTLVLPPGVEIVSKATDAERDAYSAFDGTDLHERMQRARVRRIFIGGLATDYCVLWTVHDALERGYEVVVLEDAVRPIDVRPGDGRRALRTIRRHGARTLRGGTRVA